MACHWTSDLDFMTAASTLPFSDTLRVRYSDTDPQGHLYFANYLVYADEVAGFYMESLGLQAMNPQQAPCFIFTVNVSCDYLGECKSFDTVRVFTGYSRLGRTSADISFEIYNEDSASLLAKGSITQVFTDKETRAAIEIPALFRAAIVKNRPSLT